MDDREVQDQQRQAEQVARRRVPRAEPECQPRPHDEKADVRRDEDQRSQIFSDQQNPARDRLDEHHRDRPRLEEFGEESGRPDHREQGAACPGDPLGQDRLHEVDLIVNVPEHPDTQAPEPQPEPAGSLTGIGQRLAVGAGQFECPGRTHRGG